MENIELLFPSNLNIEAADKCGSLLANFAFGDFHTLKQEPINYQQYLNLQTDDEYPSNFSLLDQQLYAESNYPQKISQEESSSRSTASCNQSSQEFEKMSHSNMERIIQKARRIMYRERAKQRKIQKDSIKQNTQPEKEDFSIQVKQEDSVQCQAFSIDPKEQRKQQQQLRNRISAQQSRDKRKQYVQQLEDKSDQLQERIKQLEIENERLKGKTMQSSKALFNKETAKIGFVVFSLMALICSAQVKAVDELEAVNLKEITGIKEEQQFIIVQEENKKKIAESQQIILEKIETKEENSEIEIKNEYEEEAEKNKNYKIKAKPIRKQRKQKQANKNK